MRIRVRLFAAVREIVGERELEVEVAAGTTAAGIVERLAVVHPRIADLSGRVMLAVNREYVEGERILAEGDEVALIPPVSGGDGEDQYAITEEPVSLDAVARRVRQDSSGAVAGFLGVVRDHARGRQVRYLEYDAYPEMALAKMREIGEEIRRRWPVDRVAIVHRIGRLEIGEASVAIAVASPHRAEALEACAYAIERLKAIVPIWKKEVWTDGAEWIGSTVEEYREGSAGRRAPGTES
jgi:molybdopterin synthase catalytic subunit